MAEWRDQKAVEIFVPIPRAGEHHARQVFEALKTDLAKRYGGVTSYAQAPAEGLWADGEGLDVDRIVVLEVMVDQLDLEAWAKIKADLEKELGQDEILIRSKRIQRLGD